MKTLLAAVILVTGLGYAQKSGDTDRKAAPDDHAKKATPAAIMRRLEAVSWDPTSAQLTWFISVWDLESDMSKPAELERYVIRVNEGVMERNGERRSFEVPGADLRALMDVISTYAMRSTVWWGRTGTDDRETPDVSPDGSGGTKDKTKGDGRDDKPKAVPSGKAIGFLQNMGAPAKSSDTAAIH